MEVLVVPTSWSVTVSTFKCYNFLSMSEGERTIQYWNDRWVAGKSGWHKSEVNEYLIKNHNLLFPSESKGTILVPLCGKSKDVNWLYQQGHHVIGVEGVESVVQELLTENDLSYKVEDLSWGKLYQTNDKRLQIYVCDLFVLEASAVKKCDAVWDRGSIVAINPSDRERYASLLKTLLSPKFNYLLSVLDYEANEMFSGPPCSVPQDTIQQLFGDVATCTSVSRTDVSEQPNFVRYGIARAAEQILLLTNK